MKLDREDARTLVKLALGGLVGWGAVWLTNLGGEPKRSSALAVETLWSKAPTELQGTMKRMGAAFESLHAEVSPEYDVDDVAVTNLASTLKDLALGSKPNAPPGLDGPGLDAWEKDVKAMVEAAEDLIGEASSVGADPGRLRDDLSALETTCVSCHQTFHPE